MPQKLAFSVASCSGEDPEFPVTELLYNSPDSKGWCTPRFSQYPQELTLRLEAPARLGQIQLLSHEYKIAAKVELLVGSFEGPAGAAATGGPAPDADKAMWRRLGFLGFDANERSNFTARELKSVALNGTPAHLLRLVFHRCHANSANMYSQVSLVAISILGDPLAPAPLTAITNTAPAPTYGGMQQPLAAAPPPLGLLPGGAGMGQHPPAFSQQQQPYPLAQAPLGVQQFGAGPLPAPQPQHQAPPLGAPPTQEESAAALAAELGVDVVTAQRIRDLQQQKQKAVEREDYDDAKRLKQAVDRLQAAGGAIAQLEARKRAAVEEEDYDLAKQLKIEVDRMRAAAYAAALGEAAGDPASWAGSRRGSVAGDPSSAAARQPVRPSGDGAGRRASGQPAAAEAEEADANGFASPPARRQAPAASPAGRGDWSTYDDRPAQAKGAYTFEGSDETSLPTTSRPGAAPARRALQSRGGGGGSDAGPAPPGFPSDLPPPDPFSAADAKEASPLVDLLGEYLARCAYSKAWQLREAALARVASDLEAGKLAGDGGSDALRPLCRSLLLRTLKDRVPAVVAAALKALRALVAAAAGKASNRDLQAALSDLLPALVERACDSNQRVKEQCTEALVALAGTPEAGLGGSTGPFLRACKPNTAAKVVLGRLQLLSALLPAVGMAGRSGDGFSAEAVMDFVNPALGNSSAEVRSAAVALTLQVAQLAGPSVQRLLPADLNAKVRAQIEQGLINPTAALAAAGGPAAAATPAAAAGKSPAAPARGAAPPAAAATPHPARAAAPPPALQQQQQAQPPAQQEQQQPGSPGTDDDPAPYEAEVRAREARLGPSHPDVAEAICNLAIVHNQEGNVAAALPLYERALAIWEATTGPDTPDVAHTLTDIAVIHLEQGRDDIGRPLLQRALRIQEAHLGPDHPDVAAIRDVLEES